MVQTEILFRAKTIAIVGLSSRKERPSYMVAEYLKSNGYSIVPVNPRETEILGETAYRTLEEIPFAVDIVNVFRRSEDIPPIAEMAVKIGTKCFWMQLGISCAEARELLEPNGICVIENECIKIHHQNHIQEESNR